MTRHTDSIGAPTVTCTRPVLAMRRFTVSMPASIHVPLVTWTGAPAPAGIIDRYRIAGAKDDASRRPT
jgi:hypothetical protein